ncbi:hypothetical protein MML48_2g00000316 [Holotrichia oblita]|uniref:Uncharacterized protein n=1 Tax=Holotrichia oblita TaxID=644536 RepID=A0ACB9TJL7_HOLOL|nr:hypothetical protein MML48_2g00000316 [Holotrichia oblita]
MHNYYNHAVTQWLRENPGRTVNIYQVFKLFNEAYEKTASLEIASSGFRATGISPFNANIFPDHMFLPSLTTDTPGAVPVTENEILNENLKDTQEPKNSRAQALIIFEPPKKDQESGTANISPTEPLDHTCPPRSRDNIHKILTETCPFPQSNVRNTTKRKSGCYQDVLTESAYLQSLPDKENEKNQRQSDKKNDVKRKLVDEREKKQQQQRKSQRNVVKRKLVEDDSSGEENPFRLDDDEEDCACPYCNGLFSRSKSKEWWLGCQLCQKWCHVECAGLSRKAKNFICELCQP